MDTVSLAYTSFYISLFIVIAYLCVVASVTTPEEASNLLSGSKATLVKKPLVRKSCSKSNSLSLLLVRLSLEVCTTAAASSPLSNACYQTYANSRPTSEKGGSSNSNFQSTPRALPHRARKARYRRMQALHSRNLRRRRVGPVYYSTMPAAYSWRQICSTPS